MVENKKLVTCKKNNSETIMDNTVTFCYNIIEVIGR